MAYVAFNGYDDPDPDVCGAAAASDADLAMDDCVRIGRTLCDAAVAYMDALRARDATRDISESDEARFEEMVELLLMVT
jgi:hypothetical protein